MEESDRAVVGLQDLALLLLKVELDVGRMICGKFDDFQVMVGVDEIDDGCLA